MAYYQARETELQVQYSRIQLGIPLTAVLTRRVTCAAPVWPAPPALAAGPAVYPLLASPLSLPAAPPLGSGGGGHRLIARRRGARHG